MTINYTIKIPEKCYVGFNLKSESSVPLGYMCPYEVSAKTGKITAADQKQIDKIDYWAKYGYHSTQAPSLQSTIVDNKPMIGFRISRSLRRLGYSSQSTFIRIEDPRGFELDITIANLIMLTDNNLIENGEILRECVWGRDGVNNVLLPINSEPYIQAKENTDRVKQSVNSRTIKLGSKVVLKNGMEGVYVGPLYATEISNHSTYGYRSPRVCSINSRDKKYHYIKVVNAEGKIFYYGFSSLQASAVVEAVEMTKAEINEMIIRDFMNGASSSQPGCHYPFMLTSHVPKFKSMNLEKVDLEAIRENKFGRPLNIPFMIVRHKDYPNSKLIMCQKSTLDYVNPGTGARKYIYGLGYVSDNKLYGAEIKIETNTYTYGQSEDVYFSYEEADVEVFRLKFEFEIPELNQNLTFI